MRLGKLRSEIVKVRAAAYAEQLGRLNALLAYAGGDEAMLRRRARAWELVALARERRAALGGGRC